VIVGLARLVVASVLGPEPVLGGRGESLFEEQAEPIFSCPIFSEYKSIISVTLALPGDESCGERLGTSSRSVPSAVMSPANGLDSLRFIEPGSSAPRSSI
jgi:hypothetical protein